MSLHERTGKRPLGFSVYHRTLPKEWSMIDIDGELYCEPCKEPLALLETVRGNGGHYKTTPTKSAHSIRQSPDRPLRIGFSCAILSL